MTVTIPAIARPRILVVDDSEDQRTLLARYFERAGCDVVAVGSAEEAILAYSRQTPDLAVIDLVLPGITGWDLTARLKAERPECAIAITSVLDATDYPEAQAVLPKPFTGAQVRRVLRDHVPRWSAQ
ncbi:MAG: response regulator [Microbacteriaceae bacterium]|jgi:CheY-like chemotaxis protein|nr:response regulator [Microbacteriaceae bacterium]